MFRWRYPTREIILHISQSIDLTILTWDSEDPDAGRPVWDGRREVQVHIEAIRGLLRDKLKALIEYEMSPIGSLWGESVWGKLRGELYG